MNQPVCIDFETRGIEGRPAYPPVPVGVAIKWPGEVAKYFAWGHPTGNNCERSDADRELRRAWDHPDGVLMHNAKFDIDVAEVHFGLPRLPWRMIHDTMFLLFLHDPHAPDMHLKSSAERILDLPPSEQEEVRDWLVQHQPVPGAKISISKASDHYWARYICMAPGDLVGRYAIGDVERTAALFDRLHDSVTLHRGMGDAYDRERRLMLVLLGMERGGTCVNLRELDADVFRYVCAQTRIEGYLGSLIGAHGINWDSGPELIDALSKAGKIDRSKLLTTATGKESKSKDSLNGAVTDPVVLALLRYRAQLCTSLRTFMIPWLEMARKSGGRIFTNWHQTRDSEGGSRTGRLSSSPNLQNIPNPFRALFDSDAPGTGLPRCPIDLPPLPNVRRYIVPEQGHILIGRDYSQQEPRILAHFEDGELFEAYQNDPWFDLHTGAQRMILARTGKSFERKPVKVIGLGLLYGMGKDLLAEKAGVPVNTAVEIKTAYLAAVPKLGDMFRDMKIRAANDLPFYTWGGREYRCQPPANGKTFDYKMLNHLIQGSASDCTKEAVLRYEAIRPEGHYLVLTVHDELLVSCPIEEADMGMEILRQAMESVEFDVPMLSEGKSSTKSWADMKDYDKRGVRCPVGVGA